MVKPLPALSQLLDVREVRDGLFVKGACWIPLSELRERISELPPSTSPLLIAAIEPLASEAERFLRQGRRSPILTEEFRLTTWPQEFRLWQVNDFLREELGGLTPGRAVDLGCGVGREAVTLASEGWKVLGIDILPDALVRAEKLAGRYGVAEQIRWSVAFTDADLTQATLVCAFYFFDRDVLRKVIERLTPGCHILIEAFTETHADRHGRPGEHRRAKCSELESLFGLHVIHFDENWRESGRHTARLHAIV